jgi:hypothetical protein
MALDHEPETRDLTFVHDGHTVKRFVTVARDRAKQLMRVSMRYVEEFENAPPKETTGAITMRWFWRFERLHLVRRLAVEGSAYANGHVHLLVLGRKAQDPKGEGERK